MKINLAAYTTLYGAYCELKGSNDLISLTYKSAAISTSITLNVRSASSHTLIVKTRAGTTVVLGVVDSARIEYVAVRNELVNILSQQADTIKQAAQSLEDHLRECECIPDHDPAIEQVALATYPALNAMVNTLRHYGQGTQAVVATRSHVTPSHVFELESKDGWTLVLSSSADDFRLHIDPNDVVIHTSYQHGATRHFTHTVDDTSQRLRNVESMCAVSPLIEYREKQA